MRFLPGLILVACAVSLSAQTEDSPELVRAKAGIERLRTLVDQGVLPRAQLVQAEAAIADAQDAALLRRTVYGNDLTADQADEMLAAAARRFERRKLALESGRKLVDGGVASLLSLSPLLEELDSARKEQDLAELRAGFQLFRIVPRTRVPSCRSRSDAAITICSGVRPARITSATPSAMRPNARASESAIMGGVSMRIES